MIRSATLSSRRGSREVAALSATEMFFISIAPNTEAVRLG